MKILPNKNIIFMFFILLGIDMRFPLNIQADLSNIRFDHISLEQGLSQSSVLSITQDKYGFMWFATQDGLNKYDGYEFTVYRNDPKDPASISANHILVIHEDKNGILWAGTNGGGLNRYNAEKDTFTHYKHDRLDSQSINDNRVKSIYEDSLGGFWIGTEKGLNKFNRKSSIFKRYHYDKNNKNSLSHDNVTAIYEDHKKILWIGTKKGLNGYDRANDHFVRYKHNPSDTKSISHNEIWCICEDKKGNLWIGTWGGGLNKFYRNTESFVHYSRDRGNRKNSISDNYITRMHTDKDGVLWVGTKSGGLNTFDHATELFTHYRHNLQYPYSLSQDHIISIHEDRSGIMWIGTLAGGLNKFSKSSLKHTMEHYTHVSGNPKSLNNHKVWSIIEDSRGKVWIGTDIGVNTFDRSIQQITPFPLNIDDSVRAIYEDDGKNLWFGTLSKGLIRYDQITKKISKFEYNPDNANGISENTVISIYQDGGGILWFGTWDGGLNRFDDESGTFRHYKHNKNDPDSISDNIVRCIHEDNQSILWVGTNNGLNKFDGASGRFDKYINESNEPNSLSNNVVRCLYQSKNGDLWIGTSGGLNKFMRATETFISYRESDGLANDTVYGILEDEKGHLWLSTNHGLSSFNPLTKQFINYDVHDGLQSNEFNAGAYHENKNGEFFFGGINGFNIFHPNTVKRDNKYNPKMVLTKFLKFHQTVKLDKPLPDIGEIVLPGKDNIFSFNFALMDFSDSEKNNYAYKLENFDRDWIDSKTKRFATYTNLNPGSYNFKVKGSNSHGVWSKEISTAIIINPSWWQTWWFKVFAVTCIFFLVYTAVKFYDVRERFNNMAYMGGYITHEINNPLASLRVNCDLLEKIYSGKDARIFQTVKNIKNDVVQINEGVNTFRDLDPIYVGSFRKKQNYKSVEMLPLLKECIEITRLKTNLKGIALEINAEDSVKAQIDPVDFKIIAKNFLLNATYAVNLKKQSDNYKRKITITIGYTPDKKWSIFEVKDNGIGMDNHAMNRCKRPYFSTKNQSGSDRKFTKEMNSTSAPLTSGIGLAIVQNKVDKYKMKLKIESKEREGSAFRILIPIKPETGSHSL